MDNGKYRLPRARMGLYFAIFCALFIIKVIAEKAIGLFSDFSNNDVIIIGLLVVGLLVALLRIRKLNRKKDRELPTE